MGRPGGSRRRGGLDPSLLVHPKRPERARRPGGFGRLTDPRQGSIFSEQAKRDYAMRRHWNWFIPLGSFLLALVLSFLSGNPMSAFSLRQTLAATAAGCHRPVVIPGDELHQWNVDGVPFQIAVPADCAVLPPGIFPAFDKFKTVDCRKKNGNFLVSSQSLGQLSRASAAPEGRSRNNVRKELHLTRTPLGPHDCCDTFSGGADLALNWSWVIERNGPLLHPGAEGRVLMSDPGHPRRQLVRTEWVDCDGIERFRERTIVSFLDAEIAWNPAGKITLNKSILRIGEFFESDVKEQDHLFKPRIIRGKGDLGAEPHLVFELHPDLLDPRNKFRGQQLGDVAASVRITGDMQVIAEAPRGRFEEPTRASSAFGAFYFQVNQHKLVDQTENITVPDP
jgi:hypothetical protein